MDLPIVCPIDYCQWYALYSYPNYNICNMLLHPSSLPLLVVCLLSLCCSNNSLSWAYNYNSKLTTRPNYHRSIKLFATRLEENIDGVLYVNDKVRLYLYSFHYTNTCIAVCPIYALTALFCCNEQLTLDS